jgi:hypothetical protein
MALINCPDCGKEISDKTEKCLHCGCPISPVIITRKDANVKTDVSSKVVVQSKEGCFLQTLNTGCMILAVIIGIIVLLFFGGGLSLLSYIF